MKIYTKTGDNGSTSLIGGTRVAKDDLSIETFGTLDELNAQLGLLRPMLHHQYDKAFVTHIQSLLFVIGSYLASDPAQPDKRQRYLLPAAEVQGIEKEIDKIVKQLPTQTAFVLPGGCRCAAQADVCRTVCRRAERRMISFHAHIPIQPEALQYINRLSDYLYVLARKINFQAKVTEKKWEYPW